jgi:hypothetical protein
VIRLAIHFFLFWQKICRIFFFRSTFANNFSIEMD